jgi:hypothetical protein
MGLSDPVLRVYCMHKATKFGVCCGRAVRPIGSTEMPYEKHIGDVRDVDSLVTGVEG